MRTYYYYLEQCRKFNEANDLPEKGWELHHILPQCLFFGHGPTIWLTKRQHAVASVLQSYEFNTCCVTGFMKKHLPERWVAHWKYWKREGFLKNRFEKESLKAWEESLKINNWNNEEVNIRRGKSISERNKDPESKQRRSDVALVTQNKPEVKAKHAEVNSRPDVKERRSKAQQAVQKGLRWYVDATGKTTKSRVSPGAEWQPGTKWKEK